MEAKWPEHVKLGAVKDKSQVIGEFLENLPNLNLILCDADGDGFGRLFASRRPLQEILAEHFGIDLKKIEQEKQEMLDNIRRGNEQEREWNE